MSSTAPDINPAKKDNTEQSIAMQCDTVRGVYKEPPNLVRFVLMCASFAVSAGRSVMKGGPKTVGWLPSFPGM